jgi:hypothetical protein
MGEPVSKRSILFEVKKGENFNHRNMLDISRIKIVVCRRDRAKGGVLKLAQSSISVFGAKCTMRKALKKSLTPCSLTPADETTSLEVISIGVR